MKFNDKLIELRRKAGLSQEELGNKLNVSRQTVSKWELGETTPEMDKLTALSKLFDISLDNLIKDDEHKNSSINSIGYKRNVIVIAMVMLFLLIVFFIFKDILFKKEESKKLTIGEIKEIAKKGQNISWFDFEEYKAEGIYDLMIGGTSEYEKPMYVRLFLDIDKDKYVDLLTSSIDDFIKDTKIINTQDGHVSNNEKTKK